MCGRYSLDTDPLELQKFLGLLACPVEIRPRFNIASSQLAPIVRLGPNGREIVMARWGLVPKWAKDPKVGFSNINARSESVESKPSFRDAFRKRRCLIPVSGFYEWQVLEKSKKQPHFIKDSRESLMAFAGIFEQWDADKDLIETFAIITTEANEFMKSIHARMPVILNPRDFEQWLLPQEDLGALKALLKPVPQNQLVEHVVSTLVNNPRHESKECVEALINNT